MKATKSKYLFTKHQVSTQISIAKKYLTCVRYSKIVQWLRPFSIAFIIRSDHFKLIFNGCSVLPIQLQCMKFFAIKFDFFRSWFQDQVVWNKNKKFLFTKRCSFKPVLKWNYPSSILASVMRVGCNQITNGKRFNSFHLLPIALNP